MTSLISALGPADIVILLAVAACVILALRSRKKHKGCSGCAGCSNCGSCAGQACDNRSSCTSRNHNHRRTNR